MSDDLMLKCLIAFILGWLASRMMGNGFSVGGGGKRNRERRPAPTSSCTEDHTNCKNSVDDFANSLKLNVYNKYTLSLDKYERFMVIGK